MTRGDLRKLLQVLAVAVVVFGAVEVSLAAEPPAVAAQPLSSVAGARGPSQTGLPGELHQLIVRGLLHRVPLMLVQGAQQLAAWQLADKERSGKPSPAYLLARALELAKASRDAHALELVAKAYSDSSTGLADPAKAAEASKAARTQRVRQNETRKLIARKTRFAEPGRKARFYNVSNRYLMMAVRDVNHSFQESDRFMPPKTRTQMILPPMIHTIAVMDLERCETMGSERLLTPADFETKTGTWVFVVGDDAAAQDEGAPQPTENRERRELAFANFKTWENLLLGGEPRDMGVTSDPMGAMFTDKGAVDKITKQDDAEIQIAQRAAETKIDAEAERQRADEEAQRERDARKDEARYEKELAELTAGQERDRAFQQKLDDSARASEAYAHEGQAAIREDMFAKQRLTYSSGYVSSSSSSSAYTNYSEQSSSSASFKLR
jgi:hypothetical protein